MPSIISEMHLFATFSASFILAVQQKHRKDLAWKTKKKRNSPSKILIFVHPPGPTADMITGAFRWLWRNRELPCAIVRTSTGKLFSSLIMNGPPSLRVSKEENSTSKHRTLSFTTALRFVARPFFYSTILAIARIVEYSLGQNYAFRVKCQLKFRGYLFPKTLRRYSPSNFNACFTISLVPEIFFGSFFSASRASRSL